MKTTLVLLRMPCMFILILAALACSKQQPSKSCETVYGPLSQIYDLPTVNGVIYYVAPDGNSESDGLKIDYPTTIEAAISKVATGDAIVMRGGTYRTGNLTFNQGITIQAYRDELPVIKGTLVAAEWQKTNDGQWVTKWNHLFPAGPESWWRRDREEKFTPMHRFNNDGVFIDGNYLQSAGSKEDVDEGTFFVDYESKEIYIGIDPSDKLVEITAFRKAIFRTIADVNGKPSDGRGPVLRGLEITQYPDTMVHIDGYYPQGISSEDQHGKDVVGTVFENCTFSKSFRIGVFAIGDSMIMRNCKVIDTNTEGVYIVASSDVLLERNIFAHNNIERWTGFFPAAVKIFNQTYRVICRENQVIDHPFSNGIWYDVGNIDGVFVNNWLEGIGRIDGPFRDDQVWPSSNAFFFEISKGAICAGNVFLNCDQGILVLNSSDVEVYNNTFINSRATFGRTARGDDADHFGWHPTTGPGVEERDGHTFMNNLVITNVGQGILVLNSSDVEVYNNTFINSRATFGRTARGDDADHFGWHPTTGPGVEERDGHTFMNNLVITNVDYPKPLLFVWQTSNLCQRLNQSTLKAIDNNVYVRQTSESNGPLMLWSPYNNEKCQTVIQSPEELNALYPEFSKSSQYLQDYKGSIFKDSDKKEFRLSEEFSGIGKGSVIPERILNAMGLKNNENEFIGAYR